MATSYATIQNIERRSAAAGGHFELAEYRAENGQVMQVDPRNSHETHPIENPNASMQMIGHPTWCMPEVLAGRATCHLNVDLPGPNITEFAHQVLWKRSTFN